MVQWKRFNSITARIIRGRERNSYLECTAVIRLKKKAMKDVTTNLQCSEDSSIGERYNLLSMIHEHKY